MSSAKGSRGAAAPVFATRDPRTAEFWDERFEQSFTPWDEGATPAALTRYLAHNLPQPGTSVFIPGAGAAHEVRSFAVAGCTPVALDISEVAVRQTKRALGELAEFVRVGDAFAHAPPQPFDWLYERAFLCALPPDMHAQWSQMVQRLIKPGGLLLGFFFLRDEASTKGPPFAITPKTLDALLTPTFAREVDEPYDTGLAAFAGGVRWQVWRKGAT